MRAHVVALWTRRDGSRHARPLWSTVAKIAALAAALSLLAASPAWGAEPAVRAGSHDGFGRLVFEWSTPIEVEGHQEGDRYRLRFGRPVDASPNRVRHHIADYLERIEPGRSAREIVLHLVPGTEVRQDLHDGRIVVLDLVRRGAARAKVKLRTGVHDGFGRIVFDWPGPVTYQASTDAGQVALRFSHAGEIDGARIGTRLSAWLERGHVTHKDGRSEVRLDLRPGVRARVFQLGQDRVVVDLSGPDGRSASAIEAPEARQSASVTAPEKAPVQAAAAPTTPAPEPAEERAAEEDAPSPGPIAVTTLRHDLTIAATTNEGGVQVDFAWGRPVPAAVFVRAGYLWTVFAGAPDGDPLPSQFPPPVRNFLGRGELVEASGGTAIRFPLRQPLAVEAERDGAVWRVRLGPQASPPNPLAPIRLRAPMRLRLAPGEGARLITFRDPEVGDRLEVWPLLTPSLGQARQRPVDLELLATAQGLVWRLLRDGVRAHAEDQTVEFVAPDGLLLSDPDDLAADEITVALDQAPAEPDLLATLTPDDAAPPAPSTAVEAQGSPSPVEAEVPSTSGDASGPAASTSPLGLAGWGLTTTPTMAERRRALLRELAESAPDRRDAVRLDLARLYLAQGLAAETLGVLGVMEMADDGRGRLARRALAGAAALLMGRRDEAEAGLGAAELAGDPEVALWRAALAAAGDDWPTAARELERSEQVLITYPLPLQPRLGLPAARIAIESGDAETTIGLLAQLEALDLDTADRARLTFLKALAEARAGGAETAQRIWQDQEAGGAAETRIKAAYARTKLLLETGALEPAEALAILEPARGLWRGLPDEHDMLDGLARIYARAGDYPSAVRTWRDLLARFPDAPRAEQVRIRMRQVLIKALLEDDGPPLGPVQAYALYQEFGHLLPGGELGDHLRRRLAARLAELDLIRPAAALLEGLIGDRLEGVAKAEVGADLAELWLREPAPEAAIDALDRTRIEAPMPAALAERRQRLRARALTDSGRRPEGLALLDGQGGREAAELRVRVLWQERDWPALITAIEPLLPAPPAGGAPLTVDQQDLVLALAVAHARLDQAEALEQLRARFASAMRGQPAEAAFLMATTTPGSAREPEAVLATAEEHLRRAQGYLDQPITN